jgi:hypothetical protein
MMIKQCATEIVATHTFLTVWYDARIAELRSGHGERWAGKSGDTSNSTLLNESGSCKTWIKFKDKEEVEIIAS